MEIIHLKETSVIYLNKNFIENSNDCEMITNFQKTIQLDRTMECGLCDIILPANIYAKEVEKIDSIDLNKLKSLDLKMELHFKFENWTFQTTDDIDPLDPYDRDIHFIYTNIQRKKFKDSLDARLKERKKIYTLQIEENFTKEALIAKINAIVNSEIMKDLGELFEKEDFDPKVFDDSGEPIPEVSSVNKLKLEFTDDQILFEFGEIYFRYISEVEDRRINNIRNNPMKYYSDEFESEEETLEEFVANKIAKIMRGERAAIFWINFNKDLHDLLGISEENFPIVKTIKEPSAADVFSFSNMAPVKWDFKYKEKYDYKVVIPTRTTITEKKSYPDVIYIYTDIVKDSLVGSQKVNILKIVSLAKNKTFYMFSNVNFIPLRVENIDSITVSLRNHLGESIYFDEGFISLTLLIRPIEHL